MRAVPLARKKAKNLLQMFGWNLWQGLDRNITHIWSKKKVAKTHSCDPNELIVSHHDIEVIGRCLVLQKRDFYDYGATYVVWTGAGYVIKNAWITTTRPVLGNQSQNDINQYVRINPTKRP